MMPSAMIAAHEAQENKATSLLNLSGHPFCDEVIIAELSAAGWDLVHHSKRGYHEVPFQVTGEITSNHRVRRAWYYYVYRGEFPLLAARHMYENYKHLAIRPGGHGCNEHPDKHSDMEMVKRKAQWYKEEHGAGGFAEEMYNHPERYANVDMFHIDTLEGLAVLAHYIKLFPNGNYNRLDERQRDMRGYVSRYPDTLPRIAQATTNLATMELPDTHRVWGEKGTYCEIHQSSKPCEHNGGELCLEEGWQWPETITRMNWTSCTKEQWEERQRKLEERNKK